MNAATRLRALTEKQKQLDINGDGKIDGENGPKTKHATRCFHRSCELADKDYLSSSDIKRLEEQHIA